MRLKEPCLWIFLNSLFCHLSPIRNSSLFREKNMELKIALICFLGVTSISAFGEFNCQEYPIKSTDALSPHPQTVRVCGTGEYEAIPILLRRLMSIEKPARHLLPPFEHSAPEQEFSNGLYENAPYLNQPYWPQRQIENFAERRQLAPAALAAPRPYPYQVINRALPVVDHPIGFEPFVQSASQEQRKLAATFDDVTAVKQSINELESNLSLIANTLLQESKAEKSEKNINVVLKLDPNLEQILNTLLQLADEKTAEKIDNSTDKELEESLQNVYASSESLEDAAYDENVDADDEDEDDDNDFLFRAALFL